MSTRYFVRLFKPQFSALVESGKKLQTVRPTPKRMPRAGDTISLRTWTGLPYRSQQRVLREAVIESVVPITIQANGQFVIDSEPRPAWEADDFAMQDGFRDANQMLVWFEAEHGLPFEGIVIFWRR